jgi:hypothetical protein
MLALVSNCAVLRCSAAFILQCRMVSEFLIYDNKSFGGATGIVKDHRR